MGFFGLYGSIAALATTLTLAAVINAVGIGFQRGNTQFLSPRLYLNTGATAAAVTYDCAGLYLETDY